MEDWQYTRDRRRHSWWPPKPSWSTSLLLISLLVESARSSITCSTGLTTAGGTFPKGDIVLEYGSGVPLEITCVLDADYVASRNLLPDVGNDSISSRIMFRNNSERVPDRYVSIVNATAAKLRVPNPPAGRYTVYCLLDLQTRSDGRDGVSGRTGLLGHRDVDGSNRDGERGGSGGGGGGGFDDRGDGDVAPPPPSSTFSTVQPTSLETSGPPPMVPQDSERGVCLNSVVVGYKPQNIKKFSCISSNWESLTCNWTKPDNPIVTNYRIFIKLPGRAGGRREIYCPKDSDVRHNTCYWDLFTAPIYRQTFEYFTITFFGNNSFGNTTTSTLFHHFANVIPGSPKNIVVMDKTQSSVYLRWSIGPMETFAPGLVHKIEYRSTWDSNNTNVWHSVNVSDIRNSSQLMNSQNNTNFYYYLNVTNLKYPFTNYDFRIFMRSSLARDDKWSAPGCITLRTKATIPRRPPRTDIGSFECIISPVDATKRDVFIYWQHIDDFEKCGESFEYRAYYTSVTAHNKTTYIRSNETHKNYGKFEGLSVNMGYNFTVYSYNIEGYSVEHSNVYVPRETEKLDEPLSFTKMELNERGVFELSWNQDTSQKLTAANKPTDYTIFWCESDKDRPYQCNGYMNWMHIPHSESSYNVTVTDYTKIYQFAISANSQKSVMNYRLPAYSSGMVWASCTVLQNEIVSKMKNVWVSMVHPTYIELNWKLDCSDRIGAVLGFIIFYCPIVSISNSTCKEPWLNKTINGEAGLGGRGNITNLKPYTTYMISTAVLTKNGEGLHSDPLFSTTLEGAPDMQNVQINATDITNTSVTLSWTQPKFMNGILRVYQVHYKFYEDTISPQDYANVKQNTYYINATHETAILKDLESYRNYSIAVTACTITCSSPSSPIQVRTAVGLPGSIAQPSVTQKVSDNSTTILSVWSKPSKPAGPIDYYELLLTQSNVKNNGDTSSSPTALASVQLPENPKIYQSNSNEFHVPVSFCENIRDKSQQTVFIKVRAVNKNPMNSQQPYVGEWSAPGSTSCITAGIPLTLHLVIWSCLFIVVTTVSTYWGNRFWRKYKIMHNVQVVLPPTLNTNYKFDHFNNSSSVGIASESGHHYYSEEEDGHHIVYDHSPTATVIYNANSSGGSSSNNNSASSTSGSGRNRWSPTTTATTVTADDGSSSSKQRLMTSNGDSCSSGGSNSDTNSVKSMANMTVAPVEPLFSLPPSSSFFDRPQQRAATGSGGYLSVDGTGLALGDHRLNNDVLRLGRDGVITTVGCDVGQQPSRCQLRANPLSDGKEFLADHEQKNSGYQRCLRFEQPNHNGYSSGKTMILTTNEHGKNGIEQQTVATATAGRPAPSIAATTTAYVMLDMVTATAAQQRQLLNVG